MAIKQIGELDELQNIPVGSKGVVVDNNNDANLVSVDTLVNDICATEVETLNTRDKSVGGAISELYAFATQDFWIGTQSQYDALQTYEDKPYLITDAPVLLWIGSQSDYDNLGTYSNNTLYIIV